MPQVFIVLFVASIALLSLSQGCLVHHLPHVNDKNNVHTGEVGEFIALMQGLDPLETVHRYLRYGCYCGLGGGGEPKDASDRCCQAHDECYDKLEASQNEDNLYFILQVYKYEYDFKSKQATCLERSDPDLPDSKNKLLHGKCNCDLKLGICLNAAKESYNKAFRDVSTCPERDEDPIV